MKIVDIFSYKGYEEKLVEKKGKLYIDGDEYYRIVAVSDVRKLDDEDEFLFEPSGLATWMARATIVPVNGDEADVIAAKTLRAKMALDEQREKEAKDRLKSFDAMFIEAEEVSEDEYKAIDTEEIAHPNPAKTSIYGLSFVFKIGNDAIYSHEYMWADGAYDWYKKHPKTAEAVAALEEIARIARELEETKRLLKEAEEKRKAEKQKTWEEMAAIPEADVEKYKKAAQKVGKGPEYPREYARLAGCVLLKGDGNDVSLLAQHGYSLKKEGNTIYLKGKDDSWKPLIANSAWKSTPQIWTNANAWTDDVATWCKEISKDLEVSK